MGRLKGNKMEKIRTTGPHDYYTNIIVNILSKKYPKLSGTSVYIPLTKEVIKLCNVLVKEQKNDNEIFPANDKMDFIIKRIFELYLPVTRRVEMSERVQEEKKKQRDEFYKKEIEKRLIKTSKECKKFIATIDDMLEYLDNNRIMLTDPIHSVSTSPINMNALSYYVSRLDYIIASNKAQ